MPYPVPPELPPLHSTPTPEAIRASKLPSLGSTIAIADVLLPAIHKTIPTEIAPSAIKRSSLKTAAPQSESLLEIASSTLLPLQGQSSFQPAFSSLPFIPVKSITRSANSPSKISALASSPLVPAKETVTLEQQDAGSKLAPKLTQNGVVLPRLIAQSRLDKSAQAVPASKPISPFKSAVLTQMSSTQKIFAATQKIAPTATSRSKSTKKAATPIKPAIAPSKVPTIQPDSLSYSISGVSGKLPQTAEALVMKKLDQAFVFDQLIEVYDAIGALTARDLRRLAKRSPRQIIPPITAQVPARRLAKRSPRQIIPPITAQVPALNPLQNPAEILIPSSAPTSVPAAPILPGDSATLNSVPLVDPLPTDQVPVSILRRIVSETTSSPTVSPTVNPVEVTADRLEYDERNQVFTAEGNVIMRFRNGLVDADRVQVNLVNRIAVAEGNVAFTRGRQVLRGQRAELNFVQGIGNIQQARGDIYIPTAGTDTSIPAATDGVTETVLGRPVSDRITSQQPLQNPGGAGGVSISAGAGRDITRVSAPKSGGCWRRFNLRRSRTGCNSCVWRTAQRRRTQAASV